MKLLEPHSKYGFSDVKWRFLLDYKTHKQSNQNLIQNFIGLFKDLRVYNHQEYYFGIQSILFGLNFGAYQITQFFKTLTTIFAYPFSLFYLSWKF